MKPTILEPYWWAADYLNNVSLQLEYFNSKIPYDQLISWITIAVLAYLAWWIAKYTFNRGK